MKHVSSGKWSSSDSDQYLYRVRLLCRCPHVQALGAQYKLLTPEQRQPYVDAAAKCKTEKGTQRAALKTAKASPVTAYLLYFRESSSQIRAADSTAKFVDIAKLVGKKWRGLSESEKQLLKERAVIVTAKEAAGVQTTTQVSAGL